MAIGGVLVAKTLYDRKRQRNGIPAKDAIIEQ
jgi:hypothetical protein